MCRRQQVIQARARQLYLREIGGVLSSMSAADQFEFRVCHQISMISDIPTATHYGV
jgi:hypothetical protein